MKRIALLLALLVVALPALGQPAAKRAMTVDDLFKFKRVADPKISPDGKWVVYSLTTVEDVTGNKSSSDLWLASTDGKVRRQLTNTAKKDMQPAWSPNGKWILFVSTRTGNSQLWVIHLDGGEAQQLTDISTEVSDSIWSPDGKQIAFASAVWPEFSDMPFKESDKLNKEKAQQREKSPVKARVFSRLFYRHWDEYVEDKRLHLFVCNFKDGQAGEPRDVTPGDYDANPTSSTFGSSVDFTFSPDGTHLLFTAPPKVNEAWSTNSDIWRISADGKGQPENLTQGNLAADGGPRFSPDGKKLAYVAQKKPGNEADRWELMVVDCSPTGNFLSQPQPQALGRDIAVDDFAWSTNGSILLTAEWQGTTQILGWDLGGKIANFLQHNPKAMKQPEGTRGSLTVSQENSHFAYTMSRINFPAEAFVSRALDAKTIKAGGPVSALELSLANDELISSLEFALPESVQVSGADGTPMQMWILKPPGFDASKKWPVAYLVHGGPQGAWSDGWSFRWCPKLWAAQGYIVALPNPRGSTGFGQKYVDEISGDWGGKCYLDLMKGVDYLETLPYVDKDRIGAAGASFGGYMMNWFAVNNGRFKCLISHCSVYNFDSMYGTTDELWFDEWEHGGPPWGKNRDSYEKHSPQKLAANLGKFKTPMLVIHNDLDFRCPIGQGHELFTALQRQGVPSRMINFPDEGHWVLKPANSRYWHQEVFAWLKKYVPPGGK